MKTLKEALEWRYANEFESGRTIPENELKQIVEVGNLMPTGFGLQPVHLVVVQDPKTKELLLPASYNQKMVKESSATVVLAVRTNINPALIAEYIERIEKIRGLPKGAAEGFQKSIEGFASRLGAEGVIAWAKRQSYIVLGGIIAQASLLGIDSHGMEGFDPAQYDEILKLGAKNLTSSVVVNLGYRAKNDNPLMQKKVRHSLAHFHTVV